MVTKVKHIADDIISTDHFDPSASPTFTNLTLTGNLTVQGTSTSLETATLQVEDKNIVLNYGSGDTSASASGAGITIQDGVNSSTDATILWDASDDEFDFSHAINIPNLKVSGAQGSDGQVLTSTGSGVAWEAAAGGVDGIVSSANATAITIDSSENVGIGRAPESDYYSSLSVLALGNSSTIYASTSGNPNLTFNDNLFINSSGNNEYQTSFAGTRLEQFNGTLTFNNAPAGTAGQTATLTERFRIAADGNVGVGTNSPSNRLHVQDQASSDTTVLRLENKPSSAATNAVALEFWGNEGTVDGGVYNIGKIYGHFDGSSYSDARLSFGSAVGGGSFDDALTVKYGKVGVGLSNPTAKLHTEGSFTGNIAYFNQTGSGGGNHGVYIDSASTSGWTFLARNGGTARFGLTGTQFRWFNGVTAESGTSTSDKGGHIRTWAGSGYLALSGDLTGYSAGSYSTLKANGSYIYFDISQTYSAYMSSNGTLNANSDRRLKENIETLSTGQLDKVCNLRGVNFDWIDQRVTGNQVGLIAQEVQEEYPELVGDGGVEDGTLTVNYAGLVSPLIEAIKELKAELDAAKARITTLEG